MCVCEYVCMYVSMCVCMCFCVCVCWWPSVKEGEQQKRKMFGVLGRCLGVSTYTCSTDPWLTKRNNAEDSVIRLILSDKLGQAGSQQFIAVL